MGGDVSAFDEKGIAVKTVFCLTSSKHRLYNRFKTFVLSYINTPGL
jgi:hypothetical protein